MRACFVVLMLALATATSAAAEPDLRKAVEAAAEALQAGNGDALSMAETALAAARRAPAADPEIFASALDVTATALARSAGGIDRARALWSEALNRLQANGLEHGATWFDISFDIANLDAAQGRIGAAQARVDGIVDAARPTQLHGAAILSAAGFFFATEAFPRAARLLEEGLAVAPELLESSFGDVYVTWAAAQERAEAVGASADAAALIDGRIAILRTFLPSDSADPIQNLLFQKFFLLYQDEEWGLSAEALRTWAEAGPISAEERAFIEEMASLQLEATQLSGYAQRREVQLDYAQLSVAFAEMLADPVDPRLGLALRERAAAETGLGLFSAAAQTLRRSAEVLESSATGRLSLHLVYADLAANAWQRSDHLLAAELYDRTDEYHQAAISAGAEPLDSMDRAIDDTNRALLAIDLGQPQRALDLAEAAKREFVASASQRSLKWNERAQAARIEAAASSALLELGQQDAAAQAARRSVAAARDAIPGDHPDLALALGNAADTLLVLDHVEEARTLLVEAVQINRAALPNTLPQSVDLERKLALLHLHDGQMNAAAEILHRVAEARKSPAYRDGLPEAAMDFELLAWTSATDAQDVDTMVEALQWTQVTRSADAVAMLEARLALDDPGHAALIRRRQDLLEAHRRAVSALLAAYATEGVAERRRTALGAELDEIEAELAMLDASMRRAGLETAGLGGVSPLSLAEIQALLAEDEVLVTFLLPGLRPDRLSWLDHSSNRAIAITRDRIVIADVAEPSRDRLRQKVAAFRCEMAPSDRGCRQRGAATRGAMLTLDEESADLPFDVAGAHALWRDLFGGIDEIVAGKPHLILAPPPDLLDLPFAALVTSDSSPATLAGLDWLIRRHAISVLPSVTSLRALRRQQRPAELTPFLGIGDPVIGDPARIDCAQAVPTRRAAPPAINLLRPEPSGLGLADVGIIAGLPRLPDAACEIRSIADTLGSDSRILLGSAASETAIKALDAAGQLKRHRVLAFATHGLVAGEAGAAAPGLVLTPPSAATLEDDGLLTAAEIATLALDAELVVLSACNTAAGDSGDADGLSGLARAFFHAGARSLLVTHWSVYSEAAVSVSTALFDELRNDPSLRQAEALRRAIQRILDAPGQSDFRLHPAYWAAFTIIGVR